MNRNFNSLAIFATALQTALYAVHGIVYFMIGQLIYSLEVFFRWYLIFNTIFFLGSFVYLVYFRLRKYQLPAWAMVLNMASMVFSVVVFIGASSGKANWIPLYMVAEMVSLVTSILFGLALVISDARKRYWLKLTGIFLIILGVALLVPSTWYLNSASPDRALRLETIVKWVLLFGFAGPLMLLLNFKDEQKQLRSEEPPAPVPLPGEMVINSIKFITALLTIFFSLTVIGQAVARMSFENRLALQTEHWDQVQGGRTFAGAHGETLRYQLIPPDNLDSSKTYPMVVCLPYGGGVDGAPIAKFLLTSENRDKYPSFLFIPFCPNGIGWGGIPNYPTMDTVVFDAIEAVEHEFKAIDADRVYISGVSRGGYGTWHFISLRPDLFAAAMPVCGGGDPRLATHVVNVSVWAFHGEKDRNVPVSGSRDMIAAIKNSGGNPKYTEFEGAGHDIWHSVTTTPGAFEWLFGQRRKQVIAQ